MGPTIVLKNYATSTCTIGPYSVHDSICGIKISSQNGPNLYVLSVYLPHESCRIAKCDDVIIDLEKYVAALHPHGVVIVIGDINSHFGSECGPRG